MAPRRIAWLSRAGAALLLMALWAAVAEAPWGAEDSAGTVGPGDVDLVLSAHVLRVIDGDGAEVQLDSGPIEVRFYGIDAPELRAPFGRDAAQALGRLIGGRDVQLLPMSQDRYERMVAVVLLDGHSVNEALIADGYAWAYRQYLGQLIGDQSYCAFEAQARTAHLGLWSQPPERWVPPWIYRARQRAALGAAVPSRDYSKETEQDCIAAIAGSRHATRAPSSQAQPPGGAGCRIKGNINGEGVKIYHLPGGEHYAETRIDTARGERWFCSEEEARVAGWRPAR